MRARAARPASPARCCGAPPAEWPGARAASNRPRIPRISLVSRPVARDEESMARARAADASPGLAPGRDPRALHRRGTTARDERPMDEVRLTRLTRRQLARRGLL